MFDERVLNNNNCQRNTCLNKHVGEINKISRNNCARLNSFPGYCLKLLLICNVPWSMRSYLRYGRHLCCVLVSTANHYFITISIKIRKIYV